METPTQFNLITSTAEWLGDLAERPGVTMEQARELQSHLLDAIDDLKGRGLTEEESFWLARRRLGPADLIAAELVKTEPAQLWRERVFWMAGGILGSHLLFSVFPLALNALVNLSSGSGVIGPLWTQALMLLLLSGSAAGFAWALARGKVPRALQRLVDRVGSPKRFVWTLCGLLGASLAFQALSLSYYWRTALPGVETTPFEMQIWFSALLNTVWPALMALLLVKLAPRLAQPVQSAPSR